MKKIFLTIFLLSTALISYADEAKGLVPIIYSDKYNISMFGIEKLQPFETEKYRKVWLYLKTNLNLSEKDIFEPAPVDENGLLAIHTREYLNSLKKSGVVAAIAELPILRFVPGFILDSKLLLPMRYAVSGTIMGCELALEYGWAINLSGGYHHAKPDSGGGFCYYADIPLAIKNIREKHPDIKILIVDLDAHQGNGVETCLKGDTLTAIMDVYNKDIYPNDEPAKKSITYDFPINAHTEGKEYLALLDRGIDTAFLLSAPDLVIYNAGTDVLEGDYVGMLNLLPYDVVKRDEMVFTKAVNNKVPILMVLSGGYTKASAGVIGKSIENIYKNIINKK